MIKVDCIIVLYCRLLYLFWKVFYVKGVGDSFMV